MITGVFNPAFYTQFRFWPDLGFSFFVLQKTKDPYSVSLFSSCLFQLRNISLTQLYCLDAVTCARQYRCDYKNRAEPEGSSEYKKPIRCYNITSFFVVTKSFMALNKKLSTIVAFLSMLLSFSATAATQPGLRVLTSIKPVQLVANAITDGVSEAGVLLPPGVSPHSHSLRPSDARKLRDADVMFWIGPDMEMFLERMLDNAKSTHSVALMESGNIKLRRNGEDDHQHSGNDHGQHHHGTYDAHIWLSPDNAVEMATTMTNTLAEMDPANAKKYKSNLRHFKDSMRKADKRNKKKLHAYQERPIFVFHDAYGYLQEHYHLNIAGHFTLNPEQQPGARHLADLRTKLRESGRTCIFREPQFEPAYIGKIVEGVDAKISVLDPLAMNIVEGPEGYPQFINGLVDNIVSCLR